MLVWNNARANAVRANTTAYTHELQPGGVFLKIILTNNNMQEHYDVVILLRKMENKS